MKFLLIVSLLPCFGFFDLNAQESMSAAYQANSTDSLKNEFKQKPLLYGGVGLGYGNRGFMVSNEFTFIFSNYWGGNISFTMNFCKSKDTPDDFYEYGVWRTPPYDYMYILSINLIKAFPDPLNNLRYGIEAGPSWVNYHKADFSNYKDIYYYDHRVSNAMGLSLRCKIEFLLNRSLGIEIAPYANINKIKPVIGMECFFHFGRVRNLSK